MYFSLVFPLSTTINWTLYAKGTPEDSETWREEGIPAGDLRIQEMTW